jgi:hypothetical protein
MHTCTLNNRRGRDNRLYFWNPLVREDEMNDWLHKKRAESDDLNTVAILNGVSVKMMGGQKRNRVAVD